MQQRIWLRLGVVGDCDARSKQRRHRGEDGPAVRGGPRHAAEGDGERCGNQEDGEHLEQVRERRRVLKRMRAVRVEEAAAVGAEHLDGFLRSDGTLRNSLRGNSLRGGFAVGACRRDGLRLDELCGVVWAEVLNNALRDKKQCVNEARRKQHPERGARGIDPEVAERLRLPT